MKTDTTVCVSLFDSLALAFHSKLDGYGREPRFVLATGINPKMVAGKAEIDRRDILLCKLILSFSPVNNQCKFPTSHCELSKLRCVWVFLIQLISEWVPLGGIVLEPPCPRRVDGISIDPEPNWNFDSLLSEIESVEKKLNVFSKFPQPFTQTTLRRGGGFVMRVSEDEMESDVDEESDEEEEEKDHSQICTKGKHFACDELYLSDESDDEFDCEPESFLLSKMGLAENIKSQVSVAETEMLQEIETFRSAIARVEKYKETRKEVERKLDLQYQRKV
ncbi:PREDICTED: protein GLE1-like [Brassica oleracea var. oleracea]|uniref:protein GLE1-like n=1 Tax=Brassica oleracea var. oleracea TaxID=109376 RepID=UPI0006A705F2|nr:PREDICTED: protein GLE1-like [Brassica oleracea var. oleracea]